jgi:4-amino-4-deoxy-L-arabinose transferase-like glycosyltransferase
VSAILSVPVATALFLLVHALAFAALAVTAYVAGSALLLAAGLAPRPGGRWTDLWRRSRQAAPAIDGSLRRSSGPVPGNAVEMAAMALPLGFLAVAQMGLFLGLLGWLRPAPAAAALVALHALAWRGWRLLASQARSAWRWARRAGRAGGALAAAALALAATPYVLLSLYPPTAFDATLYHLLYARQFAATGGLPFLRNLRYPIFPQLQEVASALVMLFADDVAAQGVTLLATFGTALLLLAWGSRGAGPERIAGGLAAAAFLGCPIVAALAGTAYVEPAMVWFGTAALYTFWRWRRGEATAEGGSPAWLVLAGVFGGGAAAVKYLGLSFVGLVSAGAAVAGGAPPGRAGVSVRGRRLLLAGVAAAAFIAPWYLRITAATGNPLFPYFPDVFGNSPWVAHEFPGLTGLQRGAGRVLTGLVRLPWDLVVARQRLGGHPPYSPFFLVLLPLLVVAARRRRRVRWLLLLAAGYAVLVLSLLPEARYLLPLAPLLALAVGETAATGAPGGLAAGETAVPAGPSLAGSPGAAGNRGLKGARHPRRLAVAIGFLLFLPGWLYAGYRVVRFGPLPVTAGAREAFLHRELPVYAAIRFLNQAAGRPYTVYALHAENMAYFAAGDFLGDWSGPAAFGVVVPANGDPLLLDRNLRRLGAGYLLLVTGKTLPLDTGTPAFQRLFRRVYADGDAEVFALAGPPPRRSRRPAN